MIVATLFYIFALVPTAHTDVLFVDLNNADKEVAACRKGAGADHFSVVNRASNGNKPLNADGVERAISRMEAQGKTIDAIVISGHDGMGEFFGGGDEENSFRSSELKAILAKAEHQHTAQNLKLMMGYGCYTGNVRAAENYWLNSGPNVNTNVSFPVQSPSKTVESSYSMLEDLCRYENRKALEDAVTLDQLCQLYHNFPALAANGASLCNHQGIASKMYDGFNGRFDKKDCYYMDELYQRCKQFDPGDRLKKIYDTYFTAVDEGFEDPPLDGEDVDAPSETSDLRHMYTSAHLYGHCMEQLKDDRGYELPDPTNIIRLVKYKQLRDNVNRLNRRQLQEYDQRLAALGMESFQVGDLSQPDEFGNKKTRKWLNRRVNGAADRLYKLAQQGYAVGDSDAAVVYRMAMGVKATLVDLNYRGRYENGDCQGKDPLPKCFKVCSHFSLVHAGIKDPRRASQCILTYEQAKERR